MRFSPLDTQWHWTKNIQFFESLQLLDTEIFQVKLFFSKTNMPEIELGFWLTSSPTGRSASLMPPSDAGFSRSLWQAVVLSFEGLLHSMIHACHCSFKLDVSKYLLFFFVLFVAHSHKAEIENSELCSLLISCSKLETKRLLIPKPNINREKGNSKMQNETTLGSEMFS